MPSHHATQNIALMDKTDKITKGYMVLKFQK